MNKWILSRAYAVWQSGFINTLLYKNKRISSRVIMIMLIAGLAFVPSANAQLSLDRVSQVKAAFILHIIRFVSWPEASAAIENENLLLCLYGDDSLNHALTSIHGKKSGGRIIQVKLIPTLAESNSCQILVIANNVLDHFVNEPIPGLNKPVLTIVDLTRSESSFTKQGNVLVALVRKGTHIGFQINLSKSRQVGLWMSSKLLKLATIVGEKD